jgi:hypothetical protein
VNSAIGSTVYLVIFLAYPKRSNAAVFNEGPKSKYMQKRRIQRQFRSEDRSNAPVSLLKSFGPAGVSKCAIRYGDLFFCNG